ncbi:MAG: tripartite tricarboxylate transporter TctB family protein [Betaproteobacteria bacterium]|nr:tripartite tricarboxylate transporter TctB family protein [Betaproteobacteria bacterium]
MDENQSKESSSNDASLVSVRTMEIATAIVIAIVALVVMWDSNRIGAGWTDMGPASGFFPFYVGLFLLIASAGILLVAVFSASGRESGIEPFVTKEQMKLVMRVFLPTVAYIGLMQFTGLYVALVIYIAGFMLINGGYRLAQTIPYAVLVPVFFFVLFEIWFLVPLPKGPIEAMLGF